MVSFNSKGLSKGVVESYCSHEELLRKRGVAPDIFFDSLETSLEFRLSFPKLAHEPFLDFLLKVVRLVHWELPESTDLNEVAIYSEEHLLNVEPGVETSPRGVFFSKGYNYLTRAQRGME